MYYIFRLSQGIAISCAHLFIFSLLSVHVRQKGVFSALLELPDVLIQLDVRNTSQAIDNSEALCDFQQEDK